MCLSLLCVLSACSVTEGPLLVDTTGPEGAAGEVTSVRQGMSFQYQIVGTVDTSVEAELFVVDLFLAPVSVIDALHARGRLVMAYLSAGTLENFRDDADDFPATAVGQTFVQYPDESWLDIRDLRVRELMAGRLDLAASKGFDGILPTNLSAYRIDNGFDLTAADQLDYTRWIAATARARGLSAGMAGDYTQVEALVDHFDWAVHFECIAQRGCSQFEPFSARQKAVFDVEYEGDIETICAQADQYGVEAILKRRSVDAYRVACP
jgi:hypothetical protein